MSQAKAPAAAPPVSLFPFLAVLLCTMGALIVILVAIAHQARRHALQAARARQAQAQARLQQQAQALQAQVKDLQRRIEQLEGRLRQEEEQLEQLVEHKSKLEQEVRRWQKLLASQGEELDAEELDRLRQRLVWYQHKLQEIQTRLKEKPQPQAAVSYAIVPFQGRHGTRRRPIYIECRRDSVLIQPGGVELRARDFLHTGPENPLVAALRTTVRHWRQQGLPPEETPYPLILVRPQGIAAYYAVRRALQNWKGPLGYELIEGDWQLEFGAEDPQLIQLQRLAVQKARRLQRQLAQGDSGPRSSAEAGLYQADVFGGLRPVAPGAGHAHRSAPGTTRRGRGSGTGSGFGSQAFQPTRSTTPAAARQGATGGNSALAAAMGSRRGASGLGSGSLGPGLPGTPARPGGEGFGSGPFPGESPPGTTTPATGSPPGLQSMLARNTTRGQGGNSLFDSGQASSGSGSASSATAPSQGHSATGQPAAGVSSSGRSAGAGISAATGGVAGGQASGRGTGGLGAASAAGGSSSLGLSSSSSGAAAGGSPAAAGAAGGSPAQQQSGSLGFSALLNQDDPTRSSPQAHHSNRHAGSGTAGLMEDPPPGAIPLRRAITVNLYPDRLVVLHNGSLRATTIRLDQPLGRWATQLTDVLAREIQSWGKAGRGMYWKPALRVRVAPGASKNWQLLQQALRTSGLELQPIR